MTGATGSSPLAARILVFAKAPVPGQAKTRLIPALGAEGAADLHRRLLQDTVARLCAAALGAVELWVTPDGGHPCFRALVERWPISLHAQSGPDLGARLDHASREALGRGDAAILVGCDCPGLTADYVATALRVLTSQDAVLGPALDGGYVLLGIKRPEPELFRDMPWGGDHVAELTAGRLDALGRRWSRLPPLQDIDRPEDLQHLAGTI